MSILTLLCPGCEKNTIIDDEDESSYCMHCGTRFEDVAREAAVPVESVLESGLRLTGAIGDEAYVPVDYSDRPWYPRIEDIEAKLIEGDMSGAADDLAVLLDENKENDPEIEACMRDVITGWLVDCIAEGEAYPGGLADLIRLIEEYGEDQGPNMFIVSLFYALSQTPELINVQEDAAVVSDTLFNLLLDYQEVEPDIRMTLDMCTDFMHVTGMLIDAADSINDDDELMNDVREWVYHLQDFVRILGDEICDACEEIGDERLDQLKEKWLDEDISTIGSNVGDIANQFLDGALDADGVRTKVKEFIDLYAN